MKVKKVMTIYGKHSNVVEYEYRGKTYYVEYANDWTYCTSPASVQHKNAQERIDKEIEEEKKQNGPTRYEDTAEYGFDLFWNYVES